MDNRERARARDKNYKGNQFVGIKTRKFHNGDEKMRNVSGHQEGENERQWKKVNRSTHNISSIKRVTMRFLEVSRSSLAKQRQRNVQKKFAVRLKLFFANNTLDILIFFLALFVAVAA